MFAGISKSVDGLGSCLRNITLSSTNLASKSYRQRNLPAVRFTSSVSKPDEYDYVVVGAGSAGCVIANRLALSDSQSKVLVTEAGKDADQSWRVQMPAGVMYCVRNKNFDWNYLTTPQKNLNGRQMLWPRGKVLGGSSSINCMVYIRGHAADYDRWAFQEGASGWSYAECLPYFIRSQKHEQGANDYRGDAGLLRVSRARSKNPLYDAYIEAGRQAGYPITDDFNGIQQEGFGRYDFTIFNGRRASASAMYLRPAMAQAGDRLKVSSETLVHRVLFNGRRAVGIEYKTRGKNTPTKRAYARKEVILCGGAINSPQLLMLSGIGPADELRRHNIQLIHHSPGVGGNLQDHLRIDMHYRCRKPITINRYQLPHKAIPYGIRWLISATGQLSFFELEAGAFVRSRPDVQHPDIQYHFLPGVVIQHGKKIPLYHAFEIVGNPLRATSRGWITLKSADPYDYPLIEANYLDTVEDVQDFRSTVTITREVMRQRAFDEYRGEEITPGKTVQSDKEIDAFIREKSETCYHPVGTCRMGSAGKDEKVVVDTECRVIGVDGLRVVDASVMPSVVSGNTNSPTIMIAEKVCNMILGKPPLPKANVADWKKIANREKIGVAL